MKRVFDLAICVILLLGLILVMLFIVFAIRLTSKGPLLYWSNRIGKDNKAFKMPKFRSMVLDTPTLATHLLNNPETYLSPIGGFLRTTSLDELPQLFSVIRGDMSLVGPRPALYNQDDLINLRMKEGVEKLLPGITGWAQVNGRDELSVPEKVSLDVEYLNRQSFLFDVKILVMTFLKILKRDGVSH